MVNTQHRAKKRFGQHFLADPMVVQNIVCAIHPRQNEHMVEIGPGLGVLTEALLPLVGILEAVELDRDLAPKLKTRFLPLGNFILHAGDALKFDFSALRRGSEKLRVVGNLPYNISTPLLFHLFAQIESIKDMHFMLQKEVVDRLCATPNQSAYGRLSVMAQYFCQCESLLYVPPTAFSPPPKVDSAVLRLTPHEQRPCLIGNGTPESIEEFSRFVALAFSQRRKTLRNTLKSVLNAEEFESCGIDPGRRAETLSLQEFACLYGMGQERGRKADTQTVAAKTYG